MKCTAMFMTFAAGLLMVASCGAQQKSFTPTERATARSPQGYTAAEYELSTQDRDLGLARVWSDGAYRKEIRGEQKTVVHIGLELENHTDQPMTLNTKALYLDSATLNRHVVQDIRPELIEGLVTIAPHSEQRVHVYFAMPPGTQPGDVDAFRVRWQIENSGLRYTQRTPFLEQRTEQYAIVYYHTPYYDPFFYDPYIYHPRVVIYNRPYRHAHIYRYVNR